MVGETVLAATLLFSIITGTAASILSLLTLAILRRSPFGRAVFVLSVVLALFVLYHVAVFLAPERVIVDHAVKSVVYTGFAAFVWLMVWSQRRLRRQPDEEVHA